MLDTIALFRTFGIVKTVDRTDQIPGDPADLLKSLRFQIITEIHIIAFKVQIDAFDVAVVIL